MTPAPIDIMKTVAAWYGCKSHLFIPGLVPGEQIDADAEANTVTYRLRTGGTWVDGKVEVEA